MVFEVMRGNFLSVKSLAWLAYALKFEDQDEHVLGRLNALGLGSPWSDSRPDLPTGRASSRYLETETVALPDAVGYLQGRQKRVRFLDFPCHCCTDVHTSWLCV